VGVHARGDCPWITRYTAVQDGHSDLGKSDRPSRVPRFRADVHAEKGSQGQMSDGSAPFAVVAATLLVCTRRRHSPADVLRLRAGVHVDCRSCAPRGPKWCRIFNGIQAPPPGTPSDARHVCSSPNGKRGTLNATPNAQVGALGIVPCPTHTSLFSSTFQSRILDPSTLLAFVAFAITYPSLSNSGNVSCYIPPGCG